MAMLRDLHLGSVIPNRNRTYLSSITVRTNQDWNAWCFRLDFSFFLAEQSTDSSLLTQNPKSHDAGYGWTTEISLLRDK